MRQGRNGMRQRRNGLILFVLVALSASVSVPLWAASRPAVRGSGGAVASDEQLATEAGLEILRAGGNAVDAAVATALALAVISPEAGNLGGGGFAVVKIGEQVSHLDFRETAPAAAHRDMYLDDAGEPVEGASIVGPLASGVPGSPSGLFALHERHGKLPWPKVVEPARRLAAEGFVVSTRLHSGIEQKKEVLARFPETAEVWLPGGAAPPIGSHLTLPDLAETLKRYAAEGPKAVTTGAVAAAVEAASSRHGGVLTAADMAAYEPVWREPVRFDAFGWQVASAALPSSGGILLGASTELLERVSWTDEERFGAGRAHLISEVWRRAYADRFLLGDPSSTQATAADLLAPDWLDRRVSDIERQQASSSADIGMWEESAGAATESNDTTHLSVVDGEGNLVALTTTINGLFGCGLYVPGAGFFLNNEMDDFAAAPGRPNMFGLIQGEANEVAAGRRMLSSQSPTIAWRDGEAVAVGGRGGSRIPTATLQVLLNLWLDGDGLQAALDRPRVHHQWRPDQIYFEPDALSPETRAELKRRGHLLAETKSLAQVHAVRWLVEGEGAVTEAAADPRGGGGVPGVVDPQP